MALIDRKIANWSNPVSNLQDKPRMTANELKAIFDSNSNEIKPAINGIIDDLTSSSGASNIGLDTIDGVSGNTVQAALENLAIITKDTQSNITTAQSNISSLTSSLSITQKTLENTNQSLSNIKNNVDILFTSNGASNIGVSSISGVNGNNVQNVLQSLYDKMMQIDTGDPNPAQYIKITEKGRPHGVASLDSSGKVPENQLPKINTTNFTIGTSTAGTTSQDCDYLCDGTNDASVINQAIADLPLGGGIITLLAGTYNLKAKISLNKNNITLIGQGEVIINKSVATNSSSGIINVQGNNCLVDNIKINGNRDEYSGICVYIAGNFNCIQNCTVENGATYGINILGEFCTAKNNILTNCNYSIYTMSSSKNAILDGNVINNNPCVAIRLQGDNSIITNTVVNTTGNGYNGIEISSENAKITNNTISLCGGYGIWAKLNNITISGNKVYQNSSYGIYISASNAIVKDNTVSNNTSIGIYVISSDCQISNNICTQNTNGIELSASASNAYISQNTISNNSNRGIMCYAPYTQIFSNNLSDNTSRNIDIRGDNCSILDNSCSGSQTSISCTSQNSKIHNNSCFEFSSYAIYVENSPSISVVANIADGGKYGISLGASNNARISENSITTASTLGIKAYNSNKIIISDNIATDSNYNLVIDNVNYSVINSNTVVSGTGQDSDYGAASIRITGTSSYNIISNNNMMGRNYIEDVGSTGNSYFNNKYN